MDILEIFTSKKAKLLNKFRKIEKIEKNSTQNFLKSKHSNKFF